MDRIPRENAFVSIDAPDPQRLRLIVEVKRHGSISDGADACRMGQPSATKHLESLEAAVGTKLLEREGRATRLTGAREIVAARARRAHVIAPITTSTWTPG